MAQAMLLGALDPPVFRVERPEGASAFVLTCDHGGRALPAALGDLGVPAPELERHIAWDIGIDAVGKKLAARLDAFQITQAYSRLVIDCNRRPDVPTSIVTRSERTPVPGNVGLSADDRALRVREIFEPYHARILSELDARARSGRQAILIALHSFTPIYMEDARAMQAGVLYQRDARLAHVMLELMRAEPGLIVGDNEPYAVSDATDYGVVVYGEQRGLLHVELEIRQDLIADDAGQEAWAARLERLLCMAHERV
jgi:predicted N-formylglutamate amidohydrolase